MSKDRKSDKEAKKKSTMTKKEKKDAKRLKRETGGRSMINFT